MRRNIGATEIRLPHGSLEFPACAAIAHQGDTKIPPLIHKGKIIFIWRNAKSAGSSTGGWHGGGMRRVPCLLPPRMVRGAGVEPTSLAARDFKSLAFTSFATRALPASPVHAAPLLACPLPAPPCLPFPAAPSQAIPFPAAPCLPCQSQPIHAAPCLPCRSFH